MLNYEKFYREIGIRKIKHLVNLKPLDNNELQYPANSMLFRYTSSDIINNVTRSSSTMSRVNKPIVNIKYKYTDNTIGKYKIKYDNNNKYISANKKEERTFTFLKPNTKSLSLASNKEFIFTYGAITANHRYQSHPLTQYHKWYNSFKTMIADIQGVNSGNDRHKFMLLEMPQNSFEYVDYDKYNKEITRPGLDIFYNQKLLTMREILRFLDPVTRKDTLFASLDSRDLEIIDIVFINNEKCVVINLYKLLSLVKGNAEKTNLAKYSFKTIYKLIMVFINNMTEAQAYAKQNVMTQDEVLEADSMVSGITNSDSADELLDSNVQLDDYMDNSSGNDETDVVNTDVDAVLVEHVEDMEEAEADVVYDENMSTEDKINAHTEHLAKSKVITKNAVKKVAEILKEQHKKKSPYPNDKTMLKNLLTYNPKDSEITTKDKALPDNVSVIDKSYNEDTLGAMKSKYIKEMYRKDIVGVIYNLQGTENIIEEHEVTENEDILGATEQHTIKIKNIAGTSNTIKFILPKIEDDGTFKLSGNRYVMRSQKGDIPIRKISNSIVGLTTYYGKLFVSKATYKKNDAGFWFRKQLLAKYELKDGLKDLIMLPSNNVDVVMPRDYGMIARYVTSFRMKSMTFSFNHIKRVNILNDNELLKKAEGSKYTLVGKSGKLPLVMDMDNKIFTYDGKYTLVGDIYSILDIDKTAEPIEFASVKLMKSTIPIGILLTYYLGLDKLLKTLDMKYVKIEPNKRPESNVDKMILKYNNIKYVIDRDHGLGDMIVGGLVSENKKLTALPSSVVNNRNKFAAVFTTLGLPILYINEIKLMEDMYVDSISKQVLIDMKEPHTFIKLLIRSAELLMLDDYKHPNDISNMYYKGYERVAGLVYKEIISSIRSKNNKSHFSKSKLEINPYSIIGKINEDSTVVLVDNVNPIAELKQKEDSTALGFGGRTETTMNKASRQVHRSEIGVTSEGTKDSGSVGVTAYLTANPGFKNARGLTEDVDVSKVGTNSLYGTSSLLAPYSVNDDPKRLIFGLSI